MRSTTLLIYCSIGALRLGALEIGAVEGMESREVDRNLSIAHCSTVQCSIAPGREAPLCGPLVYCSIVPGREAPCVAVAVILWHK